MDMKQLSTIVINARLHTQLSHKTTLIRRKSLEPDSLPAVDSITRSVAHNSVLNHQHLTDQDIISINVWNSSPKLVLVFEAYVHRRFRQVIKITLQPMFSKVIKSLFLPTAINTLKSYHSGNR